MVEDCTKELSGAGLGGAHLNPSTQDSEGGGFQPGLHSETLSQKTKRKKRVEPLSQV
jgi:hypothetical protein